MEVDNVFGMWRKFFGKVDKVFGKVDNVFLGRWIKFRRDANNIFGGGG